MHSFWEIPEVVSELVLLLPRADQARMARVNSALWEIAIPYIWNDVPDIQLFFKLFPSGELLDFDFIRCSRLYSIGNTPQEIFEMSFQLRYGAILFYLPHSLAWRAFL
ncbi:hypothetical protein M407DRAFT_243730 [Tulasnella calospora MUT 4182]|uniref:F-box domain-containing protein n=1 Tax=Tulasnella calospora MUT 4182 TaxID=1051891 RepID=A0A0C3QJN1_9AGAM|nr:hypothetical protein M407DRAFT_243730 [Tulasnella calospora MUT 4182]